MSTTIEISKPNVSFDYGVVHVKDLTVNSHKIPTEKGRIPKNVVQSISINGEPFKASKRFWTSIQCRFGFSHNVFRYFDHAEVFNRISARAPNDRIRYCVEKDGDK